MTRALCMAVAVALSLGIMPRVPFDLQTPAAMALALLTLAIWLGIHKVTTR